MFTVQRADPPLSRCCYKWTAAVYNSSRGNVSRAVFKSSTSAEETLFAQLALVWEKTSGEESRVEIDRRASSLHWVRAIGRHARVCAAEGSAQLLIRLPEVGRGYCFTRNGLHSFSSPVATYQDWWVDRLRSAWAGWESDDAINRKKYWNLIRLLYYITYIRVVHLEQISMYVFLELSSKTVDLSW